MRLAKELLITVFFVALYAPTSIAIWYATGKTANLVIVALIGLSIITAYVYFELARYKLGRLLRRRTHRTYIAIRDEPDSEPEPEPEPDYDVDDYEGFRALFSQNKHGGEAI
jgi:hypothetical protein